MYEGSAVRLNAGDAVKFAKEMWKMDEEWENEE
jgi:hypothetical protein